MAKRGSDLELTYGAPSGYRESIVDLSPRYPTTSASRPYAEGAMSVGYEREVPMEIVGQGHPLAGGPGTTAPAWTRGDGGYARAREACAPELRRLGMTFEEFNTRLATYGEEPEDLDRLGYPCLAAYVRSVIARVERKRSGATSGYERMVPTEIVGDVASAMRSYEEAMTQLRSLPDLATYVTTYLHPGMRRGYFDGNRAFDLARVYGEKFGRAWGACHFIANLDASENLINRTASEIRDRTSEMRNLIREASAR